MKRGLRVLFCLTVLALTASFIACKQPQSASTSTSVVPVVFRAQQGLEPKKIAITGTIAKTVEYDRVRITAKKGSDVVHVEYVEKSVFEAAGCKHVLTMDKVDELYTFDVKLVKGRDEQVIAADTVSAYSGLNHALANMIGTRTGVEARTILVKGALVDPAPAYEKVRVIASKGAEIQTKEVSKADIATLTTGAGVTLTVNEDDQNYTVIVELINKGKAVARTAKEDVKSKAVRDGLASMAETVAGEKVYTIKVKGTLVDAAPEYEKAKIIVTRGAEIQTKEVLKANIANLTDTGVEIEVSEAGVDYTVVVELLNKGKAVARTTKNGVPSKALGRVFTNETGIATGSEIYTIKVAGTLVNPLPEYTSARVTLSKTDDSVIKTYTVAELATLAGGAEIVVNKDGQDYTVVVELIDAKGRVVARTTKASVASKAVGTVYNTDAIQATAHLYELIVKGTLQGSLPAYDKARITVSQGTEIVKKEIPQDKITEDLVTKGYKVTVKEAGVDYTVVVELIDAKGRVVARSTKDSVTSKAMSAVYANTDDIVGSTKNRARGITVKGAGMHTDLPDNYVRAKITLMDGYVVDTTKEIPGTVASLTTALKNEGVEVEAQKADYAYKVIVELFDAQGRVVARSTKNGVTSKPIAATYSDANGIVASIKHRARGITVKGTLGAALPDNYEKAKITLMDGSKVDGTPVEILKANVSQQLVTNGVEIEGSKANYEYVVHVDLLDAQGKVVARTSKTLNSQVIKEVFTADTGIATSTTTAKGIKVSGTLTADLPDNYVKARITLMDGENVDGTPKEILTKATIDAALPAGVEVVATKASYAYTVVVDLLDAEDKVVTRTIKHDVRSKDAT